MKQQPASVLLITCDELCRAALGIYGNNAVGTPCTDMLANEGARFDNAFTSSPWCLPARCSILTGLYPHNNGAYSNFRKCALDKGIPNIFKQLSAEGYRISMFGKCHFAPVPYGKTSPDATLPYDEHRNYYKSLGIDDLYLEDGKQVSVWFEDDWAKDAEKAGILTAVRSAVWNRSYSKVYPFPAADELHPDYLVGKKAAEYIEAADPDRPLFAWISFSGPHYPMDAPQSYIDRVDKSSLTPRIAKEGEFSDPGRIHHKSYYGNGGIDGCGGATDGACMNYDEDYWERMRANYSAVVALIDERIGEIIAAATKKFGDNLLIIFTADHGEMLGNHGLWGKNNCIFNEVWRIPMYVRFPGQHTPAVSDRLVNSCDIMPTILEAAGASPVKTDGISLRTTAAENLPARDYTFAEGEGFIAVTDGIYKYVRIRRGRDSFRELFDTAADPHEFENRINDPSYAAVLATLEEQIINHFMGRLLP